MGLTASAPRAGSGTIGGCVVPPRTQQSLSQLDADPLEKPPAPGGPSGGGDVCPDHSLEVPGAGRLPCGWGLHRTGGREGTGNPASISEVEKFKKERERATGWEPGEAGQRGRVRLARVVRTWRRHRLDPSRCAQALARPVVLGAISHICSLGLWRSNQSVPLPVPISTEPI